MTSRPRRPPPRFARALVTLLLRGEAREIIVGDLDQEFAEAIAAGAPPRAARRHYWRQALASILSVHRDAANRSSPDAASRARLWRGLSLDLRSVSRALRRSPGYAIVAVLSLAIGIGANTAMFSVVRQLLYEPLPVDRANELRLVYWTPRSDGPFPFSQLNSTGYRDPSGVFYRSNFSYAEYEALRAGAAESGATLCSYIRIAKVTIATADGASSTATPGNLVSGNFFTTLRPPIEAGRPIAEADDRSGAPLVAVISHSLWTRMFGADSSVIGRHMLVNGKPVEIIGITARAYRGLSPGGFSPEADVTFALAQQPAITPEWAEKDQSLFTDTNVKWLRAIARVPDDRDATVTAALEARLRAVLPAGGLTPAQAAISSPRLFPGARGVDSMRMTTAQPLRILSVVVGIVLCLACVNVAGLMLARGVARQREIAVRRALGAGRLRLMRELLLEGVLLSCAGGAAGVLLATWTAPVIGAMLAAGLGSSFVTVTVDWPLLAAAAALACTAGILAGLIPAIRFSRHDALLLRDRASGASAPRLRVGRALLALQIAVSLPLVAGAGLFLRTLHNLGRVDLGFNPRELVLFSIDPTLNGQAPERIPDVFPRLLERLEAIPGVTAATLLENALISGFESDATMTVEGKRATIYVNSVGPHYFETMDATLLSGRALGPGDRAGGQRVTVINRLAATKYFGSESPLGRHFTVGNRDFEIVGIMADTKYDALRNDMPPTMLQSYLQRPVGAMTVVVRAALPVAGLRRSIEQAVSDVDRALPITAFRTQVEQIDRTIGNELVFARLLTAFSGFALLLACIGLHGVTSYSVARRTSEIGIRLALGARRSQVLWLVLRQVVALALVGLAIGIPAAWLAGPTVRPFMFGLEPNDPLTIVIAAAVMFGVAIAAGLWPARRAARLEALTALRAD